MNQMIPICCVCDKPLGPDTRWVPVYPDAYASDPTLLGYCSTACEDRDDGEWSPDTCVVCQREIAKNDDRYDLRDGRALQFTFDVSGNPVCRQCAGVPASQFLAHV